MAGLPILPLSQKENISGKQKEILGELNHYIK
jgi:hypothetical protein